MVRKISRALTWPTAVCKLRKSSIFPANKRWRKEPVAGVVWTRKAGFLFLPPARISPSIPKSTTAGAKHAAGTISTALPATLAGSQHQRQINNELKQDDTSDEDRRKALKEQAQHFTDLRNFELIPDGDSYIAFGSEMMQEKIVEHEAMKPAPKTSIINSGNLSTANENQAINEQLNEMAQ